MSDILEKLKPIVDKTISKLLNVKFRHDPIAGKYSIVTSLLSSAYKRHGTIIEEAIVEALRNYKHLEVFTEDKFPISSRADTLASQSGKDLEIIKGTDLPYEKKNPARTLQIDCIVFNKKKKTISSYEIKRGNGNFDAGKKRSIRNDILSTNFVLKGYGVSKNLDVKRAYSYIISYYGLRALPKPYSLIKEELDTHFGVSIVKQVEDVNNYFRAKLESVIQQNIK